MQIDDSYYYERVNLPTRAQSTSHAIFGNLLQPNLLESYHVYKRVHPSTTTTATTGSSSSNSSSSGGGENAELVLAVVQLGHNLNGHEGVVHGGILALLLDDAMGFAYEALGVEKALTASLKVDYRAPVLAGSTLVLKVHLFRREGRKLYFAAQVTSPDGEVLYAEASSLYVVPRQDIQENAA
jgi:acyl-coenzyme A thioesterase PaaI-like protein